MLGKDMLGLRGVSKADIELILDLAMELRPKIKNPALRGGELSGRVMCSLFYEDSTRTRVSFATAAAYMGASSIDMGVSLSSVNKGETLADTARNLDAFGIDALVVRHSMSGAAALVAENVSAAVINGGDGANEHPTQALLDILTLRRIKGNVSGLKIAIIGDIAHSRVANSNAYGMTALGASVTLCGFKTLLPLNAPAGVYMTDDIREAVKGADAVMALRVQKERIGAPLFPSFQEYVKFYKVTPEVLSFAKDDAVIMHPGPLNRDVEISHDLADSSRSVIMEQASDGVAVRMALLKLLIGR